MRLIDRAREWINGKLIGIAMRRPPDFVVGDPDKPYLRRWWLIPRNRWFNVYLHQFLRDDDDRALHDHMYPWCSILLEGGYVEHTIAAGGVHHREVRYAPSIKVSGPWRAHRIELLPSWWMTDDWDSACDMHREQPHDKAPCWTLFITGPRIRSWGFHCPSGWRHWRQFVDPTDPGRSGRGCGEVVEATSLQRALAHDYSAEMTKLEIEVEARARRLPTGDIWNDYSDDLAAKMRTLADHGRLKITATSGGGAIVARWINPEAPPSTVGAAANDNASMSAAGEG